MEQFDYQPKSPFKEALRAITGAEPPAFTESIYSLSELDDNKTLALQDWCSTHARPEWATGISIMEAAESIVDGAVENGNIQNGKSDENHIEPCPVCGSRDLSIGYATGIDNGSRAGRFELSELARVECQCGLCTEWCADSGFQGNGELAIEVWNSQARKKAER